MSRLVVVSRPGYRAEQRDCILDRYRNHADRISVLAVNSVDFSATEIRRRALPAYPSATRYRSRWSSIYWSRGCTGAEQNY